MADNAITDDRTIERDDPICLSDADADRLLEGARWQRFVVLGDSLAEGVGDPAVGYWSAPWPTRTAEALRRQSPQLQFLNLGRRELLTSDVRAEQLGPALDFAPDLAAIVCGGNDIFSRGFDPVAVEEHVDAMVGQLRAVGADVVVYKLMDITRAMPELAALRPRIEILNDIMFSVGMRHGALRIDMWNHPEVGRRDLYSQDRKHPTARGHCLLAAETIRHLGAYLAAGPADTGPS